MSSTIIRLVSMVFIGAFFATVAEKLPIIASIEPQNGVFVTNTVFMKTVIELKNGRFRYWFESDAKGSGDPFNPDEIKYPLEGNYTVDGNTVSLKHDSVFQKEWSFRSVDGTVSLWRPDALKVEEKGFRFAANFPGGIKRFKLCGSGDILVLTDRSGEEAWSSPPTFTAVPTIETEQTIQK